MYIFPVLFTIFAFYSENVLKQKLKKKILPEICIAFGRKYFHTLQSDNCSSCLCKCFSLKFTQRVTVMKMESNQEVTQKDGLAPGGGGEDSDILIHT